MWCIALVFDYTAEAQVRLPKIFGDNMVLQRNVAITIWGWAEGQSVIDVQFNKQHKNVRVNKEGKWFAKLAPESAGGPFQLVVKGKNTIVVNNILVGDVWVCSGQSNMEWLVKNSSDASREIAQAVYPDIRHFKIPNATAEAPKNDLAGGEWKICSPENVGEFTAVGFFFAREINHNLNIPIGILNTSWGGTNVETWTSREAFEDSNEFKEMIAGMPKLNLDSLANLKAAAALLNIQRFQGSLPASASEANSWSSNDFNDTTWRTIQLPGLWEKQELGDLDGSVWFRRNFVLDKSFVGQVVYLNLGMIDDSDITFVNGIEVGKTINKYNEKRVYSIPAGVLREGSNVVAIRVTDTGSGGGLYGEADDLKINIGGVRYPLAGSWKYKVESIMSSTVGPNSYPSLLFNAMIHPLLNIKIKGVIWYQGEANVGRAYQYRKSFPLMISDWRKHWEEGDIPFYFVQLSSFNAANGNSNSGSTWAELREAQTATLSLPNTGMAVTTDIGETNDIHPKNKLDVGKRLAAIALHRTYGKNIVSDGPRYDGMTVEGDKVIVTFTEVGTGLMTNDKYGYIKGFEIAGQDREFHYAKALIKGNRLIVYKEGINNPVAVRYGWTDDAKDCNLYNNEGFPAIPFRTDSWKGLTEKETFKISN